MAGATMLGFIGLGRMGANMVARLLEHDGKAVVWNRSPKPVKAAVKEGAVAAKSVPQLIKSLKGKKVVWLMLPSGHVTEQYFQKVLKLLPRNSVLVDGSNSNFHDSIRRHEQAKKRKVHFLDIGVSGGLHGRINGYCMMAGGSRDAYKIVEPFLKKLCIKNGYNLVGKGGAGHYVKMVHNAIEYGMMQAISEGFELLDANCHFDVDLKKVAKVYRHGSIISSFLMDMAHSALTHDKNLDHIKPVVDSNGEGLWAAMDALMCGVPFAVNTFALYERYASKDQRQFRNRMLAAIRNEFGGHKLHKR